MSLKALLEKTSGNLTAAHKQADEKSRETNLKVVWPSSSSVLLNVDPLLQVSQLEEELIEARSQFQTLCELKASLELDVKESGERFAALEEKHQKVSALTFSKPS